MLTWKKVDHDAENNTAVAFAGSNNDGVENRWKVYEILRLLDKFVFALTHFVLLIYRKVSQKLRYSIIRNTWERRLH